MITFARSLIRSRFVSTCLTFVSLAGSSVLAQPAIEVDTPMAPPAWALAQWALLDANCEAAFVAANKYVDERGWMRITPNWGAMDGADDVTETYRDLPIIYMLGGPPEILRLHKKIWEGHLDQYILKRAGDPGAVAWRRLTAIELDNMIRDLTGHAMQASRYFPIENFGGEGFSNLGNVQNLLSGPVLDKYLAMAEKDHASLAFLQWFVSEQVEDRNERV